MLERIKQNKGIVILILVVVVILVIYQFSTVKKSIAPGESATPTPQARQLPFTVPGYNLPVYSKALTDKDGFVDLNSEKVKKSIEEKSKISSQLPIYVEGFKTKTGIETTLNVYSIPEDPDYLIHIEIYGITYGDPNLLADNNPNALAFVESFNQIKNLLVSKGVDIHNVYFVLGSKPYVLNAADSLVRKYSLY